MKFNDAWEKVYDIIPEECRFRSDDEKNGVRTAKILAMLWSMLAVSENKLDDIAYVDNNMRILSMDIGKDKEDVQKDTESETKSEPKKRGRKSKGADDNANIGDEGLIDATTTEPREDIN